MESAVLRDLKSAEEEEEEERGVAVENSRYVCKICCKKFVSGRALGGHMRAHGPVALASAAESNARLGPPQEFVKKRSRVPEFESAEDDECTKSIEEKQRGRGEEEEEEDEEEEEEEEEEECQPNGTTNPMYALRRNPKRSWRFVDRDYLFLIQADADVSGSQIENSSSTYLRNSRICEACGREFSSWKALWGHMKGHLDRPLKTHVDKESEDDDNLEENWEFSQKSESIEAAAATEEEAEEEDEDEETAMESESDAVTEQPQSKHCGIENSSRFDRWMKGKRSKRPRYALQSHPPPAQPAQFPSNSNEEEELAICLVMLSSGVNTMEAGNAQSPAVEGGAGISGSRNIKVVPNTEGNASELQKSAKKRPKSRKIDTAVNDACDDEESKKTRYACTACNKVFHSYQALGGHRASHKKVRGCFSRLDLPEENGSLEEEIIDEQLISRPSYQLSIDFRKAPPKGQAKDTCSEAREISDQATIPVAPKKKSKVHECSICHRVFGSGQALGGHKRCHWGAAGTSDTISTVSSTKEPHLQQQRPAGVELDLNLPAPVDDDEGLRIEVGAGRMNSFGATVVDSHRPPDAEAYSKISPPCFQPWWMGNYPKQGLFLYKEPAHLSRDDEADSKLGIRSGLSRGQDSASRNGATLVAIVSKKWS